MQSKNLFVKSVGCLDLTEFFLLLLMLPSHYFGNRMFFFFGSKNNFLKKKKQFVVENFQMCCDSGVYTEGNNNCLML